MNKLWHGLCAAGLLCAAPMAMAQSTTDLNVTGAITPAACVPIFSDNNLDIGTRFMQSLNTNYNTELTVGRINLSVSCQGASRFAVGFSDNRASSAMTEWGRSWYGVGLTPAGEPFGSIQLYSTNHQIDGARGYVTSSNDRGATWLTSILGYRTFGSLPHVHGVSTILNSNAGVTAASSIGMDIDLILRIRPSSEFSIADEITIDSEITAEVIYL